MLPDLSAWLEPKRLALLVEVAGSAYLTGYVLAALWRLRGPSLFRLEAARLLLAEGVVTSLSFKTAASLLKILEVQTWSQIGLFAAVLALRTLFKRFFTWEAEGLRRTMARRAPP